MIRVKVSCSVRYSRCGENGGEIGTSRLPLRQSASVPSKCPPSVWPSCAMVRPHHEIVDSPPSDQPTPSSPLPARLLYDRDSCGVTAPRPAGTHNGTLYCAAPSSLTENSPCVQPKFGALSTSPPGGSPIGAAARPVNVARAGGTDVHDDKTKPTATTAAVSSRAGLSLAAIRRVASIRPQNGTDKKNTDKKNKAKNRALVKPGPRGPASAISARARHSTPGTRASHFSLRCICPPSHRLVRPWPCPCLEAAWPPAGPTPRTLLEVTGNVRTNVRLRRNAPACRS